MNVNNITPCLKRIYHLTRKWHSKCNSIATDESICPRCNSFLIDYSITPKTLLNYHLAIVWKYLCSTVSCYSLSGFIFPVEVLNTRMHSQNLTYWHYWYGINLLFKHLRFLPLETSNYGSNTVQITEYTFEWGAAGKA